MVGSAAVASCVAEPDATCMLLDLFILVNWNTRWGTDFWLQDLVKGFCHCHLIYWFFFRDLLLCVCAKKMIDIMRGQTRTNGIFYSRAIGRVIASKGESKGGGPSYSFEGMAAP